jgi:hypothetical protein
MKKLVPNNNVPHTPKKQMYGPKKSLDNHLSHRARRPNKMLTFHSLLDLSHVLNNMRVDSALEALVISAIFLGGAALHTQWGCGVRRFSTMR